MRVNRRFLYTGVFLLSLGGVLVVADLVELDADAVVDALRLWPFALVAIGVALLLRRTSAGVPAGMLAAAAPGLLIGGLFAAAPDFSVDCAHGDRTSIVRSDQGTFAGPASVVVTGACGSFSVNTAPGNGWQLEAANSDGRVPVVRSSGQSLSIESIHEDGWHFFEGGRDDWDLTLPTSTIADLSFAVNAGDGEVGLPGADIGRLDLTANAARLVVDASSASIGSLSAAVNAGALAIRLPADSDVTGSVEVGAGQLEVCTPPGLGLRVTTRGAAEELTVDGQRRGGSQWQSQDYLSAAHHADLDVDVSFGKVEINPIGGCR